MTRIAATAPFERRAVLASRFVMFLPIICQIGEEGWIKDMPPRREVIKGDSRVEALETS
jgi:hypothetical protein